MHAELMNNVLLYVFSVNRWQIKDLGQLYPGKRASSMDYHKHDIVVPQHT